MKTESIIPGLDKLPDLNETTFQTLVSSVDGETGILVELYDEFISSADEIIGELSEILEKGDMEDMKMQIHSFKGLSGAIGASRLHEITKVFDENLRTSKAFNVAIFIELLKTNLNQFRVTIKTSLDNPS